jgi:hypothetical protein
MKAMDMDRTPPNLPPRTFFAACIAGILRHCAMILIALFGGGTAVPLAAFHYRAMKALRHNG